MGTRSSLFAVGFMFLSLAAAQTQPQSQEQPPATQSQPQSPQQQKKPEYMTATARLAAAKTVFLTKTAGSDIPFDVINSSLEGWGRFMLVNSPAKADIIIQVSSPEESGGTSVSSSTKTSRETGRPEQSWSSSRQLPASSDVKLVVLDSKTKVALWTATERAKSAMKKVDRENNLVEAAERLVSRFHDEIEPPVKQ